MEQLFSLFCLFMLGCFVLALVAMWRRPETQPPHRAAKEIDCRRAALVVLVIDKGEQMNIEIHGKQMEHIAYAAAFLTQLAAKRCHDGFEKGIEHIQADAIYLASREG